MQRIFKANIYPQGAAVGSFPPQIDERSYNALRKCPFKTLPRIKPRKKFYFKVVTAKKGGKLADP